MSQRRRELLDQEAGGKLVPLPWGGPPHYASTAEKQQQFHVAISVEAQLPS